MGWKEWGQQLIKIAAEALLKKYVAPKEKADANVLQERDR